MQWSKEENKIIIQDYFIMLLKERDGKLFNKSEHNKKLRKKLNRSKKSIEFKHCNISYALMKSGLPFIVGYKPMGNIQKSLATEVEKFITKEIKQKLLTKKAAISPTDLDWFHQLRAESLEDDVINFWTPTPWNLKKISRGDNYYFMLKSPIRKIGGYGKFLEYKIMKASEAWKIYGRYNGVENLSELIDRTSKYASKHSTKTITNDPKIGCIILEKPIFFEDTDFIKPEDLGTTFAKQIVTIKIFEEGKKKIKAEPIIEIRKGFKLVKGGKGKRRKVTQKERKNQDKFRKDVLKAYNNKCSITGIKQKEVLEAAHIQQYINEESNYIENGLCLRADIHKLFDSGLISIDKNYKVVISPLLEKTAYKKIKGKKIRLPKEKSHYPSSEALRYHNKSLRK